MSIFVSVIIPNYNHAPYLDVRFQSVLNQTYKHFEVIVLDDKSSDNSLEIINKYKLNRHISHIISNDINSGSPFVQWNKGFRLAKGDLVWIAESDDCCEPTFLERLVGEFEKDSNLSFAFTRSIKINEGGLKGNVLQPMFPNDIKMDGKEFIKKYLIWGNKIWNASSVVLSKKNAMLVDSQYMNYKGAGDWLFWIEMAERGNVAVVSEPLNQYRIYDMNTTNTMRLNGDEDIEDKRIYDYLKSKSFLSLKDELRLKKAYVYGIKYINTYSSEQIRNNSLRLWKPLPLLHILAYITKFLYGKL